MILRMSILEHTQLPEQVTAFLKEHSIVPDFIALLNGTVYFIHTETGGGCERYLLRQDEYGLWLLAVDANEDSYLYALSAMVHSPNREV